MEVDISILTTNDLWLHSHKLAVFLVSSYE